VRYFKEEIEELQKRLAAMSGLVESAIRDSVALLGERREGRQILLTEERVNRMEVEIDDFALGLLALHQPTNGESRLLATAVKIGRELEQMGDTAIQIAERALALAEPPPMRPPPGIGALAELAESMVGEILDAFANREGKWTAGALHPGDAVGKLRDAVLDELTGLMGRDPAVIGRALDLIFITRNLESIVSQAAAITEEVGSLIRSMDGPAGALTAGRG
jgi:phosphate transport system protein